MNLLRKIILLIYSLTVLYVGINYVPVTAMFGFRYDTSGARRIEDLRYVTISELSSDERILNDSVLSFELNIPRAIYNFSLITIVFAGLFAIADTNFYLKKK